MKCRVIGEVFVSYIFLITFVETFLKDFILNRVVYAPRGRMYEVCISVCMSTSTTATDS